MQLIDGRRKGPRSPANSTTSTEVLAGLLENADSLLSKGKYNEAIAAYSEAIRVDPKQSHAYHGRGVAYGGVRKHDEAIADCTEAIRLDPTCARAYEVRGLAHLSERQC